MKNLLINNIFPVAVGSRFGKNDNELYLVYAPLSDNMFMATPKEVAQLNNHVGHPGEAPEEISDLLGQLLDGIPAAARENNVNRVEDFLLMYVLPNYTCNFSCSYCFSAKGRSKQVLKPEHLKVALNFFIDRNRIKTDRVALSFLGGGEPMLSWDLVKYGIEYANILGEQQQIQPMISIITNGSLVTNEMIDTISRYQVTPRFSFEVLKEIQDKQRGQYTKVSENLKKVCDAGIHPIVRSMITPLNVERMSEMVQILIDCYPEVNLYMFDPITDNTTFRDVAYTKTFYRSYQRGFTEARLLARKAGKELKCAPLRNLEMIVERYCTGEFCLTPEGTLSICHQISSPQEKGYVDCVYGKVNTEEKLEIDREKFVRLIHSDTVHDNPACENCFVKWNCGGGCMVRNRQYTPDILEVICDFTRQFTLDILLERLDESLQEEGISLVELINE